MAWREELHPRDNNGRFTRKGSLPAVSIKNTLANPQDISDDDLIDVFHRLSSTKKLDEKSLRIIDNELLRREGLAKMPPPDDTPEQQRIDALVRKGYHYAEAFAEVYGGPDQQASEARALVDKQAGETLEAARRRAYREMVALSVLQAEEATRGNLLRHKCRAVDPVTLWGAAPARARTCASEELMRWWEANGGRQTYAEFRAQLGAGGRRGRRAAERSRLAGSGKDFGV